MANYKWVNFGEEIILLQQKGRTLLLIIGVKLYIGLKIRLTHHYPFTFHSFNSHLLHHHGVQIQQVDFSHQEEDLQQEAVQIPEAGADTQ